MRVLPNKSLGRDTPQEDAASRPVWRARQLQRNDSLSSIRK